MKRKYTFLLFVGALTSTLVADTIELKSGVKYQGSIISEDEKSYLFKINVSSTITDERRIQKGQIRKIIADAKDASDFRAVSALVPTPDLLSKEAYKKLMKQTSGFLKSYPKSKHTKKVKAILETLEKENKVVADGGIKLDGQLISASDIEANAYDIDARISAKKVKRLAKNGNYQLALRQWESLQQKFPHSLAYKESLTLVSRLLKAHQAELQKHLDTLDARVEKRKAVIASLDENDAKRTEKILVEKKALYESIIAKEKDELKTKWLTIDPFDKQAVDYNLRNATSAIQSVSNIKVSDIKLAGPDLRGAWSALAKGDVEEASKHIQSLVSLRVPAQYTDPLSQQLTDEKSDQAAEKKAAEEAAADAAEEAAKKKGRRRK